MTRDSIFLAALLTFSLAAGVIAEARAAERRDIDDIQEGVQ
jgi:hypothetical protein